MLQCCTAPPPLHSWCTARTVERSYDAPLMCPQAPAQLPVGQRTAPTRVTTWTASLCGRSRRLRQSSRRCCTVCWHAFEQWHGSPLHTVSWHEAQGARVTPGRPSAVWQQQSQASAAVGSMSMYLQVVTREVAPRHRIQQPIQPGSTPRGQAHLGAVFSLHHIST